ncbi:MAG TPA: DUF3137 domain-containing protein [Candidatus Coprocola pullicola]|nr:DUF3137 domain-containing protein [Candidatus Coprocola pullicola]
MAIIEQNISGVKLEKMRQKANRKTKFMFKLPKFVFIVCVLFTLSKNMDFFRLIFSNYEISRDEIIGGIFMIMGGVLMSFCIAAASFGFYLWIFWKKSYDIFNDNYKNKYAFLKIKEVPGFSNLKYSSNQGITFDQLLKANLLPGRAKSFFKSKDYFEGIYDKIRFCASSVETYETNNSAAALFRGQVIVFSMFHEFKISQTAIQIFPKKQNSKMKGLTFSQKVETENEVFNNMFSVFAEDGHNAFYILTPRVMEDIMKFAQIINNNIYIVFADKYMYVGCEHMQNPFDAVVDLPIEEQSKNIAKATDMIQKARDILIYIENQ